MVLLRKKRDSPSLNAISESLARAFNSYNKKLNEKDQFEFGEAVSNDAKTLAYHVDEENTTKILCNLLPKMDCETNLNNSGCMTGFYFTPDQGVEVLREMNNDEFEDLIVCVSGDF